MHAADKNDPCDVFDDGHDHRHDHQNDRHIKRLAGRHSHSTQRGYGIHAPQTEAVKGQIRSCEKSRIDPFSFRVGSRKEAAKKHFHTPSQAASYKK